MEDHIKLKREPFQFLDYYKEEDKDKFFGRMQEVQDTLARTLSQQTLILYGASGCGKTSLVFAGVFPLLREKGWTPIYVRTLDDPTMDLIRAIEGELPGEKPHGTLEQEGKIIDFLGERLEKKPVVLVLDQFEEFFIRFKDMQNERARFIKLVAKLLNRFEGRLKIIFSLREDYFANLEDFQRYIPGLLRNNFRIRFLTAFSARVSIEKTLKYYGILFEQMLLTKIVDSLEEFHFDPVTLQILCTFVYRYAEKRVAESGGELCLKRSDLEDIGGVDGLFRSYLKDDVMEKLHGEENKFLCKFVLSALVTTEKTKQAMKFRDFAKANFRADEADIKGILKVLGDSRLVREEGRDTLEEENERGSRSEDWYELSHERLAPIISDWLERDPQFKDFRDARETILFNSSKDNWQFDPNQLLTPQWLDANVRPHQERFEFGQGSSASRYILQTAVNCGSDLVIYWAQRYGLEHTEELLVDLLSAKAASVRKSTISASLQLKLATNSDAARKTVSDEIEEKCRDMAAWDEDVTVRREAGKFVAQLDSETSDKQIKKDLAKGGESRKRAIELLTDFLEQGKSIGGFPIRFRLRAIQQRKMRVKEKERAEIARLKEEALKRNNKTVWGWSLTVGLFAVLAGFYVSREAFDWRVIVWVLAGGAVCHFLSNMFVGASVESFVLRKSLNRGTSRVHAFLHCLPTRLLLLLWALLSAFFWILVGEGDVDTEFVAIVWLVPASFWVITILALRFHQTELVQNSKYSRSTLKHLLKGFNLPALVLIGVAHISWFFQLRDIEGITIWAILLFAFFCMLITCVSNAFEAMLPNRDQQSDVPQEISDGDDQRVSTTWRTVNGVKPFTAIFLLLFLYSPRDIIVEKMAEDKIAVNGSLPPGVLSQAWKSVELSEREFTLLNIGNWSNINEIAEVRIRIGENRLNPIGLGRNSTEDYLFFNGGDLPVNIQKRAESGKSDFTFIIEVPSAIGDHQAFNYRGRDYYFNARELTWSKDATEWTAKLSVQASDVADWRFCPMVVLPERFGIHSRAELSYFIGGRGRVVSPYREPFQFRNSVWDGTSECQRIDSLELTNSPEQITVEFAIKHEYGAEIPIKHTENDFKATIFYLTSNHPDPTSSMSD